MKQIKYESTYKKTFKNYCPFARSDTPCTAIERLASLINSDWKHSCHWNYDDRCALYDDISGSLNREMDHALKRLKQLQEAERILDSITESVTSRRER